MQTMNNAVRANDELSLVMQQITEEVAKLLLPHDVEWLLNQLYLRLSRSKGERDEQKRVQIMERFANDLVQIVHTMPRHTMAYRTARAIFVSNAGPKQLDQLFGDLDLPTIGKAGRKKGKEDLRRVLNGQDPLKIRRSVARVDDATIVRMVKHTFSCVQTLSWGTKKVRENGSNEVKDFPKLTRTLDTESMARDFARKEAQLKAIQWNEDDPPLHRSIYFEVCSMLTSKGEKKISFIDYVQDILLNVAPDQRKQMKDHLRVVQHFLKYQYDGHLSKDDSICSHNIRYALGLAPPQNTSIKGVGECKGCNFVKYFMQEELRDEVESNHSQANSKSIGDALAYLEDSLDCFHRYQQRAIAKIQEEVQLEVKKIGKHGEKGTTVIITLDFKQKYLETRVRSSQLNDFGQRGITWHIVVIESYVYKEPSKANGFKGEAKRVQVPLDQILSSGNRQDGPCVLSMLEAVMKFVEKELDFAREINANCYHSKEMIFSICLLNQLSSRLKIIIFVHPETQDGKGPCDSHAATAGKWVDVHFICIRKDGTLTYSQACTPKEVATTLCSNSGVKNSAVQLIKLDFPRLAQISKLCSIDVRSTARRRGHRKVDKFHAIQLMSLMLDLRSSTAYSYLNWFSGVTDVTVIWD